MELPPPREINVEKLLWEARARIQWGDPPEDVARWLGIEGLTQPRIDEIVAACTNERGAEIRSIGRNDILKGLLICVLGVIVFLIGINLPAQYWQGRRSLGGLITAVGGLGAAYGFYCTIRGAGWLLLGAKASGSIAEIAKADELN